MAYLLSFIKYQSLGNDFVMFDLLDRKYSEPFLSCVRKLEWREHVRRICNRNTGVGADGILALLPGVMGPELLVYNADGSDGQVCLNGVRCAARWMMLPRKNFLDSLTISMSGNTYHCRKIKIDDRDHVSVTVPAPREVRQQSVTVNGTQYDGYFIDVGNPHFVIKQEISDDDVARIGKVLATAPEFKDGVNVEFIWPTDSGNYNLRVYERGVGPTQACSSGTVAAVHALAPSIHLLREHSGQVENDNVPFAPPVHRCITFLMPGGRVRARLEDDKRVCLEAEAYEVFRGTLSGVVDLD